MENRSKIPEKSVKIDPWTVSGCFWRQNGNMQRPGRFRDAPRYSDLCPFLLFSAEKVAPRVDFGTLGKSEIGPKPDFWVKTGTWDLQKWSPGGVPEKTWKINEKWIEKSLIFGCLERLEPRFCCSRLVREHDSRFFIIFEKNEKSMAKGTSKVMFFGPKMTLGRHRIDC